VTVTTPKDHTLAFASPVIVYLLIKCFASMRMSVKCQNTTAMLTPIVETQKEVMNAFASLASTEMDLCVMMITNVPIILIRAIQMLLVKTGWEVTHATAKMVSTEMVSHVQILMIA
jgi:hypothetical protein